MFIAHTGYLELFDLVVKHILPGMGLFFYFVLHFNCKFAIGKNLACDVAKLGEFKEVRKVTGLDDVLTDTELG